MLTAREISRAAAEIAASPGRPDFARSVAASAGVVLF